MRGDAVAGARRHGAGVEQIVGLIGLFGADLAGREARLQVRLRVGQQGRGPVLVGDAEPAVGDVEVDRLLFVDDFLVGVFLQGLVAEIADQALVQDVVAGGLRRAVARDQAVGKERDRIGALVHHVFLDGEQVFVVDRDGAAEFEPLAVVIGERHRVADAEVAGADLLPDGVAVGQLLIAVGGAGPAELGIERVGAAGRRQQHDRRRFRIDGLVEFVEREVVDARAFERDRAA